MFNDELLFEQEIIKRLIKKGWNQNVLKYKTEEELIQNWADVLFQNNREKNKLNGCSLTKTEISQLLGKVNELKTPHKLNSLINGKTISIIRDNENDVLNFGKEVYLKIFDRAEVAGGQSIYQIAEQPVFNSKRKSIYPNRRGDIMLLIYGLPLFHIEIKKEGIPVSQAVYQIQKYSKEGVFSNFFSLVQIFVAMTPSQMKYFANPGQDGSFLKEFQFEWADVDNQPINNWEDVCEHFLAIPMAHQLIGRYTIADDKDNTLKVLRSFQYNAVQEIIKVVEKTKWDDNHSEKGGYIWHTTGSGKTMTSFKAAQLIASLTDVDKVVFLMDRIELGTQALEEYKCFADDSETVNGTESSMVLFKKLKSSSVDDTLIVTSIQKMSLLKEEETTNGFDFSIIRNKKIVIIVDECHRSTFGDMICSIKNTFNNAIFFGFSGTPIYDENKKNNSTTIDVFGNELHRYTIADGIRDRSVLGFDPYIRLTFSDEDLREAVALQEAKAKDKKEATSNKKKSEVYYDFIYNKKMAGYYEKNGTYVKGIEDYIPNSQYEQYNYRNAVAKNILEKWDRLSRNGMFHAIFATSSISEAIDYYRIFKKYSGKNGFPSLNICGLFDPNIDNNEGFEYKENGLKEMLLDYNEKYNQNFSLSTFDLYKKQLCKRLAHKKPYCGIENKREEIVDLIIVVDQLLTGFDSKWINTLYLDKVLNNEHIIQAFSRTNRLFDSIVKPYGIIVMFRRPYTMKRKMNEALALYSGNKPFGVFVDKLESNLHKLNLEFQIIKEIFESNGIFCFETLPDSVISKTKFAKEFKILQTYLNASIIQGLTWKQSMYKFWHDDGTKTEIILNIKENQYISLLQRYKELFNNLSDFYKGDVPFDIDINIMEIRTDTIDAEYLNSKFSKFIRVRNSGDAEATQKALDDLHNSFSTLTQIEQKYANIIIHDIHVGNLIVSPNKTIQDYILEYINKVKDDQISKFAKAFGLKESEFREFVKNVNKKDINEYGKLDELKKKIDKTVLRKYLKDVHKLDLSIPNLSVEIDKLITDFIETGGFDIDKYI